MRRRCRQLRRWRARWKRRNKEIKIKTLHRMIIAHDRMSDVSGNDMVPDFVNRFVGGKDDVITEEALEKAEAMAEELEK